MIFLLRYKRSHSQWEDNQATVPENQPALTRQAQWLWLSNIPGRQKFCILTSKPGFSNTWTVNFQMFKLVLEKAEEQEIKLPTSAGSSKKPREFQKDIYFCFTDYAKAIDYVNHNKLWKILKEMGMPEHLTCLLRNLYAGQEATVRTGHGTMDWFQMGKGVHQGCILSPCLFNLHAKYIMWNARLGEAQAGI